MTSRFAWFNVDGEEFSKETTPFIRIEERKHLLRHTVFEFRGLKFVADLGYFTKQNLWADCPSEYVYINVYLDSKISYDVIPVHIEFELPEVFFLGEIEERILSSIRENFLVLKSDVPLVGNPILRPLTAISSLGLIVNSENISFDEMEDFIPNFPIQLLPVPILARIRKNAKSSYEYAKEAKELERSNEKVKYLVDSCRRIAAGESFEHPGYLRSNPKCSLGIQRLLVSIGSLHVRASVVDASPQMKKYLMDSAKKELSRWDRGEVFDDLAEEWAEAYYRCRNLCKAHILGHWPQNDDQILITVNSVLKAMPERGWVGDIHYGHIFNCLIREASIEEDTQKPA